MESVEYSGALEGLARIARADVSVNLAALLAGVVVLAVMWERSMLHSRAVYLLDFSVHGADPSWQMPRAEALQHAKTNFSDEQVDFQYKVLLHSGLGNETQMPPWVRGELNPLSTSLERSRAEFQQVCLTTIKDLLNKCNVSPAEIGIVIVNCSMFSPTPSLAATIMHHLHMKPTTIGYNLGGMGCSAGVIAIDLARELLQNHANTYALVLSTEVITRNVYKGKSRSMLIPNTIFRAGAAAMLLTNKRKDSRRAKYRLQHLVRTMNPSERGFNCVYEQEDDEHYRGVKLSKELMAIAGETLKMNLTRLGPKVLPLSELLRAGANMAALKIWGSKKVKPYIPNFTRAFKHVCIHTGGRGVIDAIESQMRFSKEVVEPSRASLFKFGNVSSSSIWYVLAYIESYKGLARGDRVWQMGFGSGFKANSAVWVANRRIQDMHPAWKGFSAEAMHAELADMEAELWRVVNEAQKRKEEEEEQRTATEVTAVETAAAADAADAAAADAVPVAVKVKVEVVPPYAASASSAAVASRGSLASTAAAPALGSTASSCELDTSKQAELQDTIGSTVAAASSAESTQEAGTFRPKRRRQVGKRALA